MTEVIGGATFVGPVALPLGWAVFGLVAWLGGSAVAGRIGLGRAEL